MRRGTLLTSSALTRRSAQNSLVTGECCRIVEGAPLCLGNPEHDMHVKRPSRLILLAPPHASDVADGGVAPEVLLQEGVPSAVGTGTKVVLVLLKTGGAARGLDGSTKT